MSARWMCVVFGVGLMLCMASATKADDGYVTGIGGAIRLMHGHPTIRMVSEEVHIQLPEGKVSARFVFRNEGRATTVEIGFPESGKDILPHPYSHMVGFQSTVDGQSVRVTRKVAQKPTDDGDYEYDYWWVKKVSFARGQTRTIVNTYTGGVGIKAPFYNQPTGFHYVLETGASWHGPIGHARIVCDLGSVANDWPLWFGPDGGKRKGRTITWDLRNFKPDNDVNIGWYPGFSDISVNGQWLWKRVDGELTLVSVYDKSDVSFKRGNVVWAPARFAAIWLNAVLKREPKDNAVSLTRQVHRVLFTVGDASAQTEQGVVALPGRVFKQDDAIYIPLQSLVKAFGGEAHFNPSGRLLITLPTATANKH